MVNLKKKLLLYLLLWAVCGQTFARNIRIYGYVTDSENRGVELANVAIAGTATGTTTNKNGYYELLFAHCDTVELVFSMIGYTTIRQRVIEPQDVLNINVEMSSDEQWIEEVEVRGLKRQTGTMEGIEASNTRVMPDATGGSIESLLITFAGVNQNNELSSQYTCGVAVSTRTRCM